MEVLLALLIVAVLALIAAWLEGRRGLSPSERERSDADTQAW